MKLRITLLFLLLLLMSATTRADDVGIAEVRLIEEEKNIYAFEVDVSPYLLNTIQRPTLPEHCTFIGEPEKISVGPMLVVRYRFTSGDTPLQPDDELLLYWQRSGIILTAYWKDGSSQRVFFDRGLAGIRVPVSRLREVKITQSFIVRIGLSDAFGHLGRMWFLHVLLVLACASLGSTRQTIYLLLMFTAGHGISLVATDVGVPSIFPAGIPVLIGLAAFLMYLATITAQGETRRFWPVLLVLGLLHGLSYTNPTVDQQAELSSLQMITARFAHNTVIDIFHVFTGICLWAIILLVNKFNLHVRQIAIYLAGGLTLAVIMIFIPDVLTPSNTIDKTSIPSIPGASEAGNATRTASRPVDLTDPIIGFMTVTPFEIRCEWLLRVRDLKPQTRISESGEIVVPVAAQSILKDELLKRFSTETIVTVDGKRVIASVIRADFVTVGSYGVSTRTTPVAEPLDRAVIGLSLAYVVDDAPRRVSLSLQPYPLSIPFIPVTFTDPWGSNLNQLTDDRAEAKWERRMAGFRRPVIRAVNVEPVTWPVLSLLIFIIAAGSVFFLRRKWREGTKMTVLLVCFLIAMGTYPFVRAAVPSALTGRVPAKEEMSKALNQLLTNIYRAFDYRTEEAIYDRLAVSATGDQLASIYLQHRSSMEIENRGGARASVDNVEVLEIREIDSSEEGLSVHASWIVSGSVNHFGHIHYRKNRYKSIVHIISSEGVWKINGVEVEEEERVL